MNMHGTRSRELHETALDVFPGGVSHNIRYFEPHPIYIERAVDSRVWDVDDNEYVDFWMNHMASVLGHSHPDVVRTITEQAQNGLHFGAPNRVALALGKKVQEFVPTAERVRFCASGTEATMYAVRLARAYTGRNHVLKAAGGWHGGNTDLSAAIHDPFPIPETAGLPPGSADSVPSFPLNDEHAVSGLVDEYGDDTAAILIEPMLLAGGGVEANQSFLRFLRDRCDEYGITLIFDEVVTGFRVSPGSYQARVDISPDLTTLGKALGGGLPIGALAGSAEYFEATRPDVNVSAEEKVIAGGGTFSMNPMTGRAGLKTLEILQEEPVFDYTESEADRVRCGLSDVFEDAGVDATVLGTSSLFLSHFQPQTELDSVAAVETQTNREALYEYHRRLLTRGYYFLPGHMGSVSYQTGSDELDSLLKAAEAVVAELVDEEIL